MSKYALDTNILIYLYDDISSYKREIAEGLLENSPMISSQVTSEYLNVSKRLLKLPKLEVFEKCNRVFEFCEIKPVSQSTLNIAEELIKQYDFQIFDAIIVATSLQENCTILYSEDMHHNLIVENKLKIINPFL
jgi:predicted nucleic acid-binding protein